MSLDLFDRRDKAPVSGLDDTDPAQFVVSVPKCEDRVTRTHGRKQKRDRIILDNRGYFFPGSCFLRAAQAVLADGPEGLHMAVATGDQRQSMGNVFNTDCFQVGICRLKMPAGVCGDVGAHGFHP